MNKIKILLLFLFLNYSSVFAFEDSVFLDTKDIFQLKPPSVFTMEQINAESEDSIYRKGESIYFESDEEIFETKAGKVFNKFIDDRIINNKINNFSTKVESKYNN